MKLSGLVRKPELDAPLLQSMEGHLQASMDVWVYNNNDIIRTMTNHYNPKKSVIVERFKFNKCNRKPSPAISAKVAELK